eukprot:TRINITY_DN6954_c0_g1_i2.p1 TRINITY_DN6954_c0_g1~~TRINITY_DN6954_c0_g1_i2.p1  ORF type:complete len:1357 (-),score=242.12 TRINITY_DN6954_c0_g1_i2:570-4553(-)
MTELYKVVSFLKSKKGQEFSVADLENATGVRVTGELLETLKNKDELICTTKEQLALDVTGDGEAAFSNQVMVFSFKAQYPFKRPADILQYLKTKPLDAEDPELLRTYENIDKDLDELVATRKIVCIQISPKRRKYYLNESPEIAPCDGDVKELWLSSFNGVGNDIEEMRKRLQVRWNQPLANFPWDEDSFLKRQEIERRQKREAFERKNRGKRGRKKGPGSAPDHKEALQGMDLELAIGDKENSIFAEDDDNDPDIPEEMRGATGMTTPQVPENALRFIHRAVRTFFANDEILCLEALLRQTHEIDNRRESKVAETLFVSAKYLRTVMSRLRVQSVVTERTFSLKEGNAHRKCACWLVTFNIFFDMMHYRLLDLEDLMKKEKKGSDQASLYFCPEETCKRVYTIEDISEVFSNHSCCLDCNAELVPAEAVNHDPAAKSWDDELEKIRTLRGELKALLGTDGQGGQGPPPANRFTARRLPGRGGKLPDRAAVAAAPAKPAVMIPTSTPMKRDDHPLSAIERFVAEGGQLEEHMLGVDLKIPFDHPFPLIFGPGEELLLPVIGRAWCQTAPRAGTNSTPLLAAQVKNEKVKNEKVKSEKVKSEKVKNEKVKNEKVKGEKTNKEVSKRPKKEEDGTKPAKVKKESSSVKREQKRQKTSHDAFDAMLSSLPDGPVVDMVIKEEQTEKSTDELAREARKKQRKEERDAKQQRKEERRKERERRQKRKEAKEFKPKTSDTPNDKSSTITDPTNPQPPSTATTATPNTATTPTTRLPIKPPTSRREMMLNPQTHPIHTGRWMWSRTTKEVHRFLMQIAELDKYHSQVLSFKITPRSLFTARKYTGIEGASILQRLEKYSGKNPEAMPVRILQLLREASSSDAYFKQVLPQMRLGAFDTRTLGDFFSVYMLMRDGRYYVRSQNLGLLRSMGSIAHSETINTVPRPPDKSQLANVEEEEPVIDYELEIGGSSPEEQTNYMERVKEELFRMRHELIEEFDFAYNRWGHNQLCENLVINLKPDSVPRSYQKAAAHSLFWDGKAHSAILVLPCGAGKTLVGITTASIIKKCVLVFCTSTMAVNQWRDQFLKWSDCAPDKISRFTSVTRKAGEWNYQCGVLITTYNMFASVDKRSEHSQRMIEKCRARQWGLMILDEVHLAPAQTFRRVTTEFRAHCKLGLTATMIREDGLIDQLPQLVGPRLYEVDLLGLKAEQAVAIVHCRHVLCPFPPMFKRLFGVAESPEKRRLLYIGNPNKLRVCAGLIKKHRAAGDRVLVFCDDIFGLALYAKIMKTEYIDGSTPPEKREKWLNRFRTHPDGAFLLISKVLASVVVFSLNCLSD